MVYLIIVLAVLARFLPHAWNFSPVYGALLFGGARLNKRESIWFPALLLGISDFILTDFVYHLHLGGKVIFQVSAFASISFAGWLLRERIGLPPFLSSNVLGAAAPSSLHHFVGTAGWLPVPSTRGGLMPWLPRRVSG